MTNNNTKGETMNETAAAVSKRVARVESEFVIELTIIDMLTKNGLNVSTQNIDKIREIMADMASN